MQIQQLVVLVALAPFVVNAAAIKTSHNPAHFLDRKDNIENQTQYADIIDNQTQSAEALKHKLKYDPNQKAYIDGKAVAGDGKGFQIMTYDFCRLFRPAKPDPAFKTSRVVKVCGNRIQFFAFTRPDCNDGQTLGTTQARLRTMVGTCGVGGLPETNCETKTIADASGYKIVSCENPCPQGVMCR